MGSEFSHLFQNDHDYMASGAASDGTNHAGNQQTPVPKVNPFVMPQNFADRQSTLQRGTANPTSTSHNSIARFGVASHI